MKYLLRSPGLPWVVILLLSVGLRLASNALSMWNVTPIAALALYGGACIHDIRVAMLLPVLALFVSDALIGFYEGMWVVYGSFVLIVFLGRLLIRQVRFLPVLIGTLTGSMVFFLITNFAFFYPTHMYPHSFDGIVQSYVAALPFYRNAVVGDLFFSSLFFTTHVLLHRWQTQRTARQPSVSK